MDFCGGLRLLTAWSPHSDDVPESLPKYQGRRSFWSSCEHDSLCPVLLLAGYIARRTVNRLSHAILGWCGGQTWVTCQSHGIKAIQIWPGEHLWNQHHIYHYGVLYALLQEQAYSYDFSLVLKQKNQRLRMTCSCCLGLFFSLEFMGLLGSEALHPAAGSCLTQTSDVSSSQVMF